MRVTWENLMVMCLMSGDFNVFKIRTMMMLEHGTQVWSYDRTSRQPFCVQKPASTVLFRSGHSIQNGTDWNWFCSLLQLKDGRFHPAVSFEEKDWWWFSVAGRKLANFVVSLVRDQFFRSALNVRKFYITIRDWLRWFCCQRSFAFLDEARGVVVLSKQ